MVMCSGKRGGSVPDLAAKRRRLESMRDCFSEKGIQCAVVE